MDLATIAGLGLGLAILVVSLLVGGVPAQTILQPEALLIVIGGTFTSLLINFSAPQIQQALGALGKAFREEDLSSYDVVDYLSDAAVYIRTKGLLAVQPLLAHVDIPYLQKGLQMIVDNQPLEHIRAQLTTEMEVQYQNDLQTANVYEAAGGFAPTMGIIGAIIGLVQVMGVLTSPEQLGSGVASAFIATLYGVGSANLFFLPIAGKLKQKAKNEWFLKSIMLNGLVAIRAGENPTLLREKLESFLAAEADGRIVDAAAEAYHYEEDLYQEEYVGV